MSRAPEEPFLAWPGWAHLRVAWLQSLLVTVWFGIIYGGADWLTAHRTARVRVHLDAELQLPLIPAFTAIYMSIYALFLVAPFVLRTRREFTAAIKAQVIAITAAGFGFLFIPAQLAYGPPPDLGIWAGLFHFADWLNLDYNLVPSLHVALSVVCVEAFVGRAPAVGKILLRSWALLIAASTLFTHQHHLVDAVTGYLLGLAAVGCVRPFRKRAE